MNPLRIVSHLCVYYKQVTYLYPISPLNYHATIPMTDNIKTNVWGFIKDQTET